MVSDKRHLAVMLEYEGRKLGLTKIGGALGHAGNVASAGRSAG